MDDVLAIAKQLIEKPSVTPNDAGCQDFIADYLTNLGFEVARINVGNVSNLWARWGVDAPLIVFAGHTDVVPAGEGWASDPFKPEVSEGKLYGRGVADMKGALAAMLVAVRRFLSNIEKPKGSIGFLITSDEEGDAINGTTKVVDYLKQQNIKIDYCVIGEPTSERQLGDTIKMGRRGSLNGKLTVLGKQGHIAYPDLSDNPIPKLMQILNKLYATRWDEGGECLPATQFEVSNIQAGLGVDNVVPAEASARFNFRFSDQVTALQLQAMVEAVVKEQAVDYRFAWKSPGNHFFNKNSGLFKILQSAIKEVVEVRAVASTSGGISDGRFIMQIANEVVELGLCRGSIHQANECVSVGELDQLAQIYEVVLTKYGNV